MSFVQIIEFTTDDIEPVRRIDEQWQEATEGKRTARRQIITRDRNDPDRYRVFVFFDSYESAMANSQLPETGQFAQKYQETVKEVSFYDLDVIADQKL